MDLQQKINDLLPAFASISLGELEGAPSMNRVDIKYIVYAEKLPEILTELLKNFRILEIGGARSFPYESVYYDTSDFLFYRQHMTGLLERYKVRHRRYPATDTIFLEVKTTTNKNRTLKRRLRTDNMQSLQYDLKSSEFLMKYLPGPLPELGATVRTDFTRITLTGENLNERITIDSNLSFSDMNGKTKNLPLIAVIEQKKERAGARSELPAVLKKFGIQSSGFSKYCYGAALLHDLPKRNLLKSKTLLINKIENEHSSFVYAGS